MARTSRSRNTTSKPNPDAPSQPGFRLCGFCLDTGKAWVRAAKWERMASTWSRGRATTIDIGVIDGQPKPGDVENDCPCCGSGEVSPDAAVLFQKNMRKR